MKYVCDAPGEKTWFRIETQAEAAVESDVMRHAVEKFFSQEQEKATQSYQPPSRSFIEQDIGLSAHVQRAMPLFLTLRDAEGNALATAMLPPGATIAASARSLSAPATTILIRSMATRSARWRVISASRSTASAAILTDVPDAGAAAEPGVRRGASPDRGRPRPRSSSSGRRRSPRRPPERQRA